MQDVVAGSERLSVGELIGKGGEGEVFLVKNRSGQAVKIYSAGLRAKREEKVRAMVREGLAAKTNLVAYPGEVVSDSRGSFIGFLMRLVSGYRPIHELYSPKSRQKNFPSTDYRFVVRAALNIARAVGRVHQTGCVIGDLNHSGVLVSEKATVALIDADSFQFKLGSKTFPCVVGVPDFTPPELHGVNLGQVQRTVVHDNFGLAVAIFHLLFMGRHPYAGHHNGPDISIGEAIAQNRFAFSLARRASTQTSPPPGALTLEVFPRPTRDAFEQAFGVSPAARPSASNWIKILTDLEGSLRRCKKIKSHYYPSSAKDCVWCGIAVKSRFDMFPSLSTHFAMVSTDTKGTNQAIKEILAFRFPTLADVLPQPTTRAGEPSSALQRAKSRTFGRAMMGLLLMVGAAAGLYYAMEAWFIWLGLGIWGLTRFSNHDVNARPFQEAFRKADQLVQSELDGFLQRSGLAEVVKVRSDLNAVISSYRDTGDELARGLMGLKSTREARQRADFLDRFSIRNAGISGIGPAKTATLISFGIETAADVEQVAVLSVPGFGAVLTGHLVAWRRRHESRFRYDPTPSAKDKADENALRSKVANKRAKLEAEIRSGLNTLRAAKQRLASLSASAHNDRSLMKAIDARALAENDLKLLGESVPASNVSLGAAVPAQPRATTTARLYTPPTGGAPNCPKCGAPMVRRIAKRGRRAGGQFWGCSRFPGCRGTRN